MLLGIVLAALILIGIWLWSYSAKPEWLTNRTLMSTVEYVCDGDKKVSTSFYQGPEAPRPEPGEIPVSNDSVDVAFDNGSKMSLRHVVSASGARFANEDESFVFWTRGYDAFVMKNDEIDTEYENCTSFDPRNSTFTIDGEEVTLVNGEASKEAAPGSSARMVTKYLDNEAAGDLNADGKQDMAFWVTQETGGSGVFYYVVAALRAETGPSFGYNTTEAFFVGDRIAPQSLSISSETGELEVNYLDRSAGEPMAAAPTREETLILKVTADGALQKVTR